MMLALLVEAPRKTLKMLQHCILFSTTADLEFSPSSKPVVLISILGSVAKSLAHRRRLVNIWWVNVNGRVHLLKVLHLSAHPQRTEGTFTEPWNSRVGGPSETRKVRCGCEPRAHTARGAHCLFTKSLSWDASNENTSRAYGKMCFHVSILWVFMEVVWLGMQCVRPPAAGALLDGCI